MERKRGLGVGFGSDNIIWRRCFVYCMALLVVFFVMFGFVPAGANESVKCENLGAGAQVQIAPRASDEVFYTTSAGVAVKKQNNTLYTQLGNQIYAVLGQGDGTMNSYVAGFTVLEYITSDATSYIDTGFYANNNTKYQTEFAIHSVGSDGYNNVYGACNSGYKGGVWFYVHNSSSDMSCFWYGTADKRLTSYLLDVKMTITHASTITYMQQGGQSFTHTYSANTFTCSYSTWLFQNHYYGTYRMSAGTESIYYFKIWDNGTLVRDFVPVKCNSCGNVGMFDKANGKFYENAGTGKFTAGPNAGPAEAVLNAPVYDNFSYASGALEEDLAYRTVEGFLPVGGVERGYLLCQSQSDESYLKLRI